MYHIATSIVELLVEGHLDLSLEPGNAGESME
jgi:hypothetical protein